VRHTHSPLLALKEIDVEVKLYSKDSSAISGRLTVTKRRFYNERTSTGTENILREKMNFFFIRS
jgi:hypothetical protein